MSAPPVVRCEIVPAMTMRDERTVGELPARVQADTGVWVAALAVPDALWSDEAFIAAVYDRAMRLAVTADGEPSGIPTQARYVAATHAELRGRAGLPEAAFGNPDGAA